MYKIETISEVKDGKIVGDTTKLNHLISLLEDGTYLHILIKERQPKTIEEFRAEYFAKRDMLAEHSGNSKKDIHDEAKAKFLSGGSTKTLTVEEWRIFIDKFKDWAFEHFNCYL